MRCRLWILVALVAGCSGGSEVRETFSRGLAAYDRGDPSAALQLFEEAERLASEVEPELIANQAMAALGAGDLLRVEQEARRAASVAAQGPMALEFSSLRDFLLGTTALERALRSRTLALQPDADPGIVRRGISEADTARRSFELAVTARGTWPAAARNLERALLILEELNGIAPSPPPRDGPDEMKQDTTPRANPTESDPGEATGMDPGAIEDLLRRLAEMDEAKRTSRRARGEGRASAVERDW